VRVPINPQLWFTKRWLFGMSLEYLKNDALLQNIPPLALRITSVANSLRHAGDGPLLT